MRETLALNGLNHLCLSRVVEVQDLKYTGVSTALLKFTGATNATRKLTNVGVLPYTVVFIRGSPTEVILGKGLVKICNLYYVAIYCLWLTHRIFAT